MRKVALFGLLFTGIVFADALTCSKGTNVWGGNFRTGKAFGPSLAIAQEIAYHRFLNNLSSLGRDCFESESGNLEFSPIQSFHGPQKQGYWASFAVNVACCR